MSAPSQLALGGTERVVGARDPADHYATPGWLVEAVLDAVALPRLCGHVLDAGAGDGRLGRAVVARRGATGARLYAVEIDPARRWSGTLLGVERITADFLTWATERRAEGWQVPFVISNPPFRLWDDFVRAMLPLVTPGGTCLVLGFVNVLGGQGRAAWWRANPPSRIWLSPRRASFTPDGQTDSLDCCWIEWGPGERRAEVRWLETER